MIIENGAPVEPPLTRHQKIEILMREYDTLRTETLERISSWFQICGGAGAAVVGILVIGAAYSAALAAVLLVIFPIPIFVMFRNVDFDMRELGSRIREIENQVNQLAEEDLLAWENHRGGILPHQVRKRAEHIFGKYLCSKYRSAYRWAEARVSRGQR